MSLRTAVSEGDLTSSRVARVDGQGRGRRGGHVAAAWLRDVPHQTMETADRVDGLRWRMGAEGLHATLAAHDGTLEAALTAGKSDDLDK